MSEIERAAGAVIVCGFEGPEAPGEIRSWLIARKVAGLILFKRNIDDLQQVASLISLCTRESDASLPPLISIDQEGGRVARLGDPVLRLPPMRSLCAEADVDLTKEAATVLGLQLRAIGINLNFAPVLDVDTNPLNPVIGDRSFAHTPELVIEHGLAFADGLREGGVLSCGKHFPGHGDTDLDSHLALPRLRHDRSRLEQIELRPFRAACERIPALMTAHVVFEDLDPELPATMSRKVVHDLLRQDIGFDGVVFSDDLEMKAVSDRYTIEEAGVLAIDAGCDALLVCSDVDATGRLRERLASEASRSKPFESRLREAGNRVDRLRRRVLSLGPPIPLQNALHHARARAVEERLRRIV